jgi:hypothetical protein
LETTGKSIKESVVALARLTQTPPRS